MPATAPPTTTVKSVPTPNHNTKRPGLENSGLKRYTTTKATASFTLNIRSPPAKKEKSTMRPPQWAGQKTAERTKLPSRVSDTSAGPRNPTPPLARLDQQPTATGKPPLQNLFTPLVTARTPGRQIQPQLPTTTHQHGSQSHPPQGVSRPPLLSAGTLPQKES